MKKTLITLLALASTAMAVPTVINFTPNTDYTFFTDSLSISGSGNHTAKLQNNDEVTLTVSSGAFYAGTVDKNWNNTAAVTDMNTVLGLTSPNSFTNSIFTTGSNLKFWRTGAGSSNSDLTLNINSAKAGDNITLYVSVAAEGSHVHGLGVTGLSDITLSYAGISGSGFSTSGVSYEDEAFGAVVRYDGTNTTLKNNWSPNAKSIMVFKIQGTLTSDNIVLDQLTTAKNGWQTLSYVITPAVPEPATATLSLLALAGLAARRRRR